MSAMEQHAYIPRFFMVPKRNLFGIVIPDKFRMFWGGRKPSKYTPHVGKKQLSKMEGGAK